MKALVLGVLLTTGCAASSPYMKETAAAPVAAKAEQATVVFIRPSGFAKGVKTTILDEGGHFMGDSLASGYFARELPPGKHMFVVWAENTDFVNAELAAGKVYYVEVSPTIGALSARVHLFAVKPGSAQWAKLNGWIAESKEYDVDVSGGEAYVKSRASDAQERVRRATEHVGETQGEDLEKRTLRATDGK